MKIDAAINGVCSALGTRDRRPDGPIISIFLTEKKDEACGLVTSVTSFGLFISELNYKNDDDVN